MNAPLNHPLPLLELDVLRTFVAIAETGSFTTAANMVFRTPSAERVFQLLDLHGDGGGRAEHGIRGQREAAGFGDGDEGAQHIQFKQRKRVIKGGVHPV